MKNSNTAVLLAGGIGSRMGIKNKVKQLLSLRGETILEKTISVFDKTKIFERIIVTLPGHLVKSAGKYIDSKKFFTPIIFIEGGKTRQESSYNTLKKIKELGGTKIVIIHDAVRPFINKDIIEDSVKSAEKYGASIVAVPAIDTLIETSGKFVKQILDRTKIFYTQTPQTFRYSLILKAHETAIKNNITAATDDAQLILNMKKPVAIVQGTYFNIKITNPIDYELAKIVSKKIKF
ncbi:MAG: hypothetical protein ACD_79C01447G0003 [uncultured bacterium]|nr:MAG: hypothetical protein ACD_79C01447G0003 [uncultured bacterium]